MIKVVEYPGCKIEVGEVIYEAPRDGPTLWEIGIPDRSAAEFYVPDPNPNYINKLFLHHPDKSAPIYTNNNLFNIFTSFLKFSSLFTGIDNMGCGKGMQNYTQLKI